MKKTCIALFLALVMACGILGAYAEEFVVGGSSLEDCVSRMVGYTVETDEKGNKKIMLTALAREFYKDNSENDIAFMPYSYNVRELIIVSMLIMPPSEITAMTGFNVVTDKATYAIALGEVWANSKQTRPAYGMMKANQEMLDVLYAMADAETVTLQFYQQGSQNPVSVEMTAEEHYLIQQFVYALRNFMTADMTTAYAKQAMSMLGSDYNYTVVKK